MVHRLATSIARPRHETSTASATTTALAHRPIEVIEEDHHPVRQADSARRLDGVRLLHRVAMADRIVGARSRDLGHGLQCGGRGAGAGA